MDEIKSRVTRACDACKKYRIRCEKVGNRCACCLAKSSPCTFDIIPKKRGPKVSKDLTKLANTLMEPEDKFITCKFSLETGSIKENLLSSTATLRYSNKRSVEEKYTSVNNSQFLTFTNDIPSNSSTSISMEIDKLQFSNEVGSEGNATVPSTKDADTTLESLECALKQINITNIAKDEINVVNCTTDNSLTTTTLNTLPAELIQQCYDPNNLNTKANYIHPTELQTTDIFSLATKLDQYFVHFNFIQISNDTTLHTQAIRYLLTRINDWSISNQFPVKTSALIQQFLLFITDFSLLKFILLKVNYFLFSELLARSPFTKLIICELALLGSHFIKTHDTQNPYVQASLQISEIYLNIQLCSTTDFDIDKIQFWNFIKRLTALLI